MCRAKYQGGRRCLPHLRLTQQEAAQKAQAWEEKVQEREQIHAQHPSAYNRRQLNTAIRVVQQQQERATAEAAEIQAREIELAAGKAAAAQKREARAARRAAQQADKGARRQVATDTNGVREHSAGLAVALTEEEWAVIDERAHRAGHTRQYADELVANRSAYVRAALGAMPVIGELDAKAFTPVHTVHEGLGRKPTVSDQIRRGPGIELDGATLTRLEREAATFGLTRSDYARDLLLGLDPRRGQAHESEQTSRARFEALAVAEERAAETGVSVQDHYRALIEEIRQQIPVVEAREAAGVKRAAQQAAREKRAEAARATAQLAKAAQREAELAAATAIGAEEHEALLEAGAATRAAVKASKEAQDAERVAEAGRVKAERRAAREQAAWEQKSAEARAMRREKVESDPEGFLTDMKAYRQERAERRAETGHRPNSTNASVKGLYEHGSNR